MRDIPLQPNRLRGPPWEEIYTTGRERKQSYAEAIATHEKMIEVYQEYGYRPIELPKASPRQRAEFLLAHTAAYE